MGLQFELAAGMKVDLVSHDELEKAFRKSRIIKETIWEGETGTTDGSGNLSLRVYQVPVGKLLVMERVILWADGYDPDTPSSTGWIGYYHGPGKNPSQLADFQPQTSGAQVFPGLAEYNHNNAPRFKGGENIYAEFVGCVASTGVGMMFQGCLEPEGYRS